MLCKEHNETSMRVSEMSLYVSKYCNMNVHGFQKLDKFQIIIGNIFLI